MFETVGPAVIVTSGQQLYRKYVDQIWEKGIVLFIPLGYPQYSGNTIMEKSILMLQFPLEMHHITC